MIFLLKDTNSLNNEKLSNQYFVDWKKKSIFALAFEKML